MAVGTMSAGAGLGAPSRKAHESVHLWVVEHAAAMGLEHEAMDELLNLLGKTFVFTRTQHLFPFFPLNTPVRASDLEALALRSHGNTRETLNTGDENGARCVTPTPRPLCVSVYTLEAFPFRAFVGFERET
jgi:hypothetical protein